MSKSVKSLPAAPSLIRTIVPVLVGQIISFVTTLGVDVPDDVEKSLVVVIGFAATVVWYFAFRFLEQKWPKLGAFLGWAATPDSYTSAKNRNAIKSEVVEDDPKH